MLKRLPLKNVPTKELATYQNEVNLLRDLSHPSIVTYIDSYQHDSHMCIVMSYCEGGDLSHFLANRATQHNPLPETEILYHFVQLVLAIHYMHDIKHVIHRDLKTQNVFLKNGLLQLGDLGISKALSSPTDFASTCIGTPYYMSPELFKNRPYNHKSDVWALGCILYEMCVMRHAFDANSINALASKIIRGDRAQLAGQFSPKLRELVGVMLDVNPSNRPSVREILHLPVVKRAVRRFVHVVCRHREFYRVKDVETFVQQVRRLGMGEMIDELNTPPPPIGPAGSASSGAAGDNREAKRTLELIGEEEREKQRLERKLAELKEMQSEKERKVAERDRRIDRVDRRRSSERARDNSNAAGLAADRRREEDKKRADEERRRREKERDKLREYEREKERQAKEAEERRRKLVELNRDRQQRDAMEVATQHKQAQQQKQQREEHNRQAAQQLARNRVKSDRERRRRDAERVEMERIRREREELNSGLREMEERASAMSEKDRVLARKEREKREREGEERERLRAARKEYEAERAKAVEWNRAVVHGHHALERKEGREDEQSSHAVGEVGRRRVDREREDEEVEEEEVEEEEQRQAVEEGKARIEQLTQHLQDYSKRLQTLKTTMQVTALIHEADDGEEEDNDDDEDDDEDEREDAELSVHLFVSIEERMRLLAKECVRRMGRDMFVRLFDAVGDARDRGESEEEIDSVLQQTEGAKTGDERWRHWRLVDQLLFMERHNESDDET